MIVLPPPPSILGPNCSVRPMFKSGAIRQYRHTACMLARQAAGGHKPNWAVATLSIIWKSKTLKHPDPVNLCQWLKPAIDGLQDAGIIVNDNQLWPERPVILLRQPKPEVIFIVRNEPTEPTSSKTLTKPPTAMAD